MFKKLYVKTISLFKPTYQEVGSGDIRVVTHKSAALAAQTFMLSMAAIEYDTCPMEGFDSKRIKKDLKLPSSVEISMVIGCGIRLKNGVYGKRFRIPSNEENSMRIENRISGSDTNPYLVIAANLAAGYLGIKNKIKPSAETKKSVFGDQKSFLPKNMEQAISLFEKNDQINDVFNQICLHG